MLFSSKVYFNLSCILLSPSNQNSILDGFKFQPDQWSGLGTLKLVDDKTADEYYKTRAYESRIGAWASKQSNVLKNRDELLNSLENFKKKYNDKNNVPRPDHWSGWNLKPSSIEFWLDGDNRIHERLKYTLDKNSNWIKNLLSP